MGDPIDIERLLNRRSDLSTFVVHLTKDSAGGKPSAKQNLQVILTSGVLQARTPMGWTGSGKMRLPQDALESMKVVCFSETPLEHVYSLFQNIRGRSVKLSSYGLAFTRETARERGVNPVWYVDMTLSTPSASRLPLHLAVSPVISDPRSSPSSTAWGHGRTVERSFRGSENGATLGTCTSPGMTWL
jgi:hypothetical protein